jgi:tetratricopeptide (TPR) repeat protein
MRTMLALAGVLGLWLSAPMAGQVPEKHVHPPAAPGGAGLGEVTFPNSGAPAAQSPFFRGLALLHSFEYEEAAEGFRDAQKADPSFAMAFWGEAVTYSHLLWGEDDPAAARQALARLAPTREARLDRAGTPRERAFGNAFEALYAEGDLPSRVRGFAAGMREVAARYPDDPDAGAFMSLALMFSDYVGRLPANERRAARDDAITFAERVFATHPRHPGGVHYLIHATDNPEFAPRGLEAARRYAAIAPDAEHALHMPSHIFVQLGLWDDAVSSNERAWAASRAEVAARKLSNADLSFHALQWLQYGYLQQGRYQAAQGLIATAREVLSGVDLTNALHVDARYTVGWLSFTYGANTGDWSSATCDAIREPAAGVSGSDRDRSFRSVAVYQAAVAGVVCNRPDSGLDALRARVAAVTADEPHAPLLKMALLHGRLLSIIRGTTQDLDAVLAEVPPPGRSPVGPPTTLRTDELVGEALLKAGRPKEAVAAYERALTATPRRSPALLGLARARLAASDQQGAAEAYRQLLQNWHKADEPIPARDEARRGSTVSP